MRRVIEKALDLARSVEPVLITGESGTGKTNLARFIHQIGTRRSSPYFECRPAGLSPREFRLGAFGRHDVPIVADSGFGLFAAAQGGTITFDSFIDLGRPQQILLYQFLRDALLCPERGSPSRGDIRLIFVSLESPEQAVKSGRLLEPLYKLLNGARLRMPPLRKRVQDVGPLLEYHLRREARACGVPLPSVSDDALRAIAGWRLRGNGWNLRRLAVSLVTYAAGHTFDREALLVFMQRHRVEIV